MTKTAKELGLKDTRYGNPHGLPHTEGKSTALDQCRLALACMKKSLFNEIVKTK
jgi:D-alanyl-D-alanine carboxypeptidase